MKLYLPDKNQPTKEATYLLVPVSGTDPGDHLSNWQSLKHLCLVATAVKARLLQVAYHRYRGNQRVLFWRGAPIQGDYPDLRWNKRFIVVKWKTSCVDLRKEYGIWILYVATDQMGCSNELSVCLPIWGDWGIRTSCVQMLVESN